MNPLLLKAKLVGYALGAGFLLWIAYQVYNAFDEREEFKSLSEKQAREITQASDLRTKERAQLVEAQARESQTLTEKKAIEYEAQANRDCIAAGNCGVRWKIKYQTCPSLPNSATGQLGADELQERNRKDSELWIANLRESVRKDNLHIVSLQEDIVVRSDPKYCDPSNQRTRH